MSGGVGSDLPSPSVEKRDTDKRIFVNRSLSLEKIKFYGFDMDYTLAEYKSPQYEVLGFNMVRDYLVEIGYPPEVSNLQYKADFPVRGLWWDNVYGNLLKVDGFGNILFACHGLRFLKGEEISSQYPNKFLLLDDSRVYVYNTLFHLPEIYLIAAIIDFFSKHPEYTECKEGFKYKDLLMSYKSIFQDVRSAMDYVHMKGTLKEKTCEDLEKYVHKDPRLPQLLFNLQSSGAKTFLLTNSDWWYTNKLMSYLLEFEDAPYAGQNWRKYFDYTLVDARKPLFFAEGTVMRRINTETGKPSLGHHIGNIEKDSVYSGGNSDVFSKLIGTKGGNVLYVGDHIFGDVIKSKKLKGWKTFLIIPELREELNVWTTKKDLFEKLQNFDAELADLYLHMDSSVTVRPNVKKVKECIRETIHKMEMTYGKTGSLFRAGSRQTFFASQMMRYADIYSGSAFNLLHYPTFYMFRAPAMLLPHESTVKHDGKPLAEVPRRRRTLSTMSQGASIEHVQRGEEPGECHDFDDDFDDHSSERSNESSSRE